VFYYRRIRLAVPTIKAKHNIPYLSESVHSQFPSDVIPTHNWRLITTEKHAWDRQFSILRSKREILAALVPVKYNFLQIAPHRCATGSN
jgi:hypothetical protein